MHEYLRLVSWEPREIRNELLSAVHEICYLKAHSVIKDLMVSGTQRIAQFYEWYVLVPISDALIAEAGMLERSGMGLVPVQQRSPVLPRAAEPQL